MLRLASLLHWLTHRRCPRCGRVEVHRSARNNFLEAALLPFLLTRPFRCENCGNRFYGLVFREKVPIWGNTKEMSDFPKDFPALVYGYTKDEEPFQEQANVRLLNLRCGLITLATRVELGQHLILINLVTEEDQRCRVAYVGEQDLSPSLIGIQFASSRTDEPTLPPQEILGAITNCFNVASREYFL